MELLINVALAALIVYAGKTRTHLAVYLVVASAGLYLSFPAETGTLTHGMVAVFRGGAGICAGIFVALAADRVRDRVLVSAVVGTTAELVAAGLIVGLLLWPSAAVNGHLLPATAAFSAVVFIFSFERGALSAVLTTTPLLLLGAWSYGIYLWHATLLYALLPLTERAIGAKAGTMASNTQYSFGMLLVLLTIALSAMTYRWYEAPARRHLYGRIQSRRKDLSAAD